MAEKQVTTMVIKIDLECEKCAKKIRKILCKIPQIQNQIYDKKANTVTITVVCCSPEKIKKKICCKGGETIKGIEIKPPSPKAPKPPSPKAPKPERPPSPKTTSNPQIDPPSYPQAVRDAALPPKGPVASYPPRTSRRECYEGGYGGPCFHGYGTPPCYDPPYGRPVYHSWGGGGCNCQRSGYYVCRCEYVCDDGRPSCIIM